MFSLGDPSPELPPLELDLPSLFPSSSLSGGTPRLPPLPEVPLSQQQSQAQRSSSTSTPSGKTLPLDAPIQPRSYLLPSVTARKRRTSAVEKQLAKRSRASAELSSTTSPAHSTTDVNPESCNASIGPEAYDIPSDLVAAVERKRLQNTLSARKSRQRKAAKLDELEGRNQALEQENSLLKEKLARLEAQLRQLNGGTAPSAEPDFAQWSASAV